MQNGHEPRMTVGPSNINKALWIKTPLGSQATDTVRTRKLPLFPDSKSEVTRAGPIPCLALKWPLASGVCGRRAEEGAESQEPQAAVEGEEQILAYSQLSLLHAVPVLGRPAWGSTWLLLPRSSKTNLSKPSSTTCVIWGRLITSVPLFPQLQNRENIIMILMTASRDPVHKALCLLPGMELVVTRCSCRTPWWLGGREMGKPFQARGTS